MADLLADGTTRASYVASIASIAAPTVAELNAGTALESIITPDGLDITPSTAAVDLGALNSTVDTEGAGRRKFDVKMTIKRQTPTDTALSLFPYRTSGYIVVRDNIASGTAWAASQNVQVYPIQTGEPIRVKAAKNEVKKLEVMCFVTADPNTSAVVAA